MIPMSDWFLRRTSEASIAESCGGLTDLGQSGAIEDRLSLDVDQLQRAFDDGYRKGTADAEAEANRRLSRETEASAASHKQALTAMATQCSQFVVDQIRDELNSLMGELTASLLGVLDPFLEQSVKENAVTRLLELVEEEILRGQDALLEVHAPVALRDRLEDMLSEHRLSATIVEGSSVVVLSKAEKATFDSLAERWIECIRNGGL